MKKADETPRFERVVEVDPSTAKQAGIDGIYKDLETGEYVFLEAKETIGSSNYGRRLSPERSYGWQMDDEWLKYHVEDLYEAGELSSIEYTQLLNSINEGSCQKQIFIYHRNAYKGTTATQVFISHLDGLTSISANWKILISMRRRL